MAATLDYIEKEVSKALELLEAACERFKVDEKDEDKVSSFQESKDG